MIIYDVQGVLGDLQGKSMDGVKQQIQARQLEALENKHVLNSQDQKK